MDQASGRMLRFKENIGAGSFKTTCDWKKNSNTVTGVDYHKSESTSQYATQRHQPKTSLASTNGKLSMHWVGCWEDDQILRRFAKGLD